MAHGPLSQCGDHWLRHVSYMDRCHPHMVALAVAHPSQSRTPHRPGSVVTMLGMSAARRVLFRLAASQRWERFVRATPLGERWAWRAARHYVAGERRPVGGAGWASRRWPSASLLTTCAWSTNWEPCQSRSGWRSTCPTVVEREWDVTRRRVLPEKPAEALETHITLRSEGVKGGCRATSTLSS